MQKRDTIKKFILKYGIGEIEDMIEKIKVENREKLGDEWKKTLKISNSMNKPLKGWH